MSKILDWEEFSIDPDPAQMNPVSSSHLARVKYNRNDQMLFVQFTDGSIWSYEGVDWGTYMGLLRAGSHGEYFADYIRLEYPYERVS